MSYIFLSKKVKRNEFKIDINTEYKIDKTLDDKITTIKRSKLYNYKDLISKINISKTDIDKISSNQYLCNIKETILQEPRETIDNKFKYYCINTIPLEIMMKKIKNKKINIILDIDQTLIFSKEEYLFNPNLKEEQTKNSFFITVPNEISKENPFKLIFDLRPKLKEFLIGLSKFCNIYICTLAKENYAKMVLNIIKFETGIEIPMTNIVATKEIKSFKLFEGIEKNNTIIFDDTLIVWINELEHLILSKKFVSFQEFDYKFDFLLDENQIETNKIFIRNFQGLNLPVTNENKFSDKLQLEYILHFIELSYKFSLILNRNIVDSIRIMRKKILNKVCLNIQFYIQNEKYGLIKGIVKFLGGTIETDFSKTTHFLISENNTLTKDKFGIYNKCYLINESWLIDSYLLLCKMDENEPQYKIIIK